MVEERKYRIVVTNLTPDDTNVREIVRKELGDKVEVVDWNLEREVHHEAYIPGQLPDTLFSQRESIVTLRYREKQKTEEKDI